MTRAWSGGALAGVLLVAATASGGGIQFFSEEACAGEKVCFLPPLPGQALELSDRADCTDEKASSLSLKRVRAGLKIGVAARKSGQRAWIFVHENVEGTVCVPSFDADSARSSVEVQSSGRSLDGKVSYVEVKAWKVPPAVAAGDDDAKGKKTRSTDDAKGEKTRSPDDAKGKKTRSPDQEDLK
jgi:hypothetical protein